MFDMRTLVSLNIIYGLVFGFVVMAFGLNNSYRRGTKHIGAGIFSVGIGFLFLSRRDYYTVFLTVILANMLIILGIMAIQTGLTKFKNLHYDWFIQHVAIGILSLCLFLYYTYASESVNARILITSFVHVVYLVEIIYILRKDTIDETKLVINLTSSFFILSLMIMVLRIVFVFIDRPVINFMDAGLIHSISVLIYQLMPFVLSVTTFWITNIMMAKELKEKAMTDQLTELYNRRAFEVIAMKELHRSTRHSQDVGLVMCDIDHFKKVNDTYGHVAGDIVLKEVAKLLGDNLRFEDVIGRYGGEEFVLLIPQVNKKELLNICEKLRLLIDEHLVVYHEHEIHCTISFGATIINGKCPALQSAIEIADIALYDAKEDGRNRVKFRNFICHEEVISEILS